MTQAEFWNKIADKYSRDPVKNVGAFERKIAITKAHLSAQSKVLGVGCGTGSLALRLAETGAECHGLDISKEMIRIARGKAKTQGIKNVTFYVGAFDSSFTEFEPESFDLVCAFSILHLVPDREAALGRMYSLLKPGGALVTSTAVLADSWIPFKPLMGLMRRLGKAPDDVGIFSKELLGQEIESVGFVELEEPEVGADSMTAFLLARRPTCVN